MPMVKGGILTGGAGTTTGRLRITIPHYKANSMQSFIIDIYEYNTDRMQSIQVGGYSYSDTAASWYNTSVIALMDSDNRDLTVRFGANTTDQKQYVSVGEVDTTWGYPQVVVRNYMAGHSTSSAEMITNPFTVEFVTTDGATYNDSHSDNQPYANWSKIEGKPSTFAPIIGTASDEAMAGNTTIPSGNAVIDWTQAGAGTIHTDNYIENVVQTTVSGSSGSCTGNAATASAVPYSGLTGTVPTWNQNTTGSAGSVAWGNITSKPYIETATVTSATATTVVAIVPHATYNAVFFDFVIKNGTNVRAGTVYACHNGASTPLVEFAETSTVDLGDTSDVTLSVAISGTNMFLQAVTTSSTWTIKSLIRAI